MNRELFQLAQEYVTLYKCVNHYADSKNIDKCNQYRADCDDIERKIRKLWEEDKNPIL